MKQAHLVVNPFPALREDGRSFVTFVDPEHGWRTLPVVRVHPRKRTVVARDALDGHRFEVRLDEVLVVLERPHRARKAREIWRRAS